MTFIAIKNQSAPKYKPNPFILYFRQLNNKKSPLWKITKKKRELYSRMIRLRDIRYSQSLLGVIYLLIAFILICRSFDKCFVCLVNKKFAIKCLKCWICCFFFYFFKVYNCIFLQVNVFCFVFLAILLLWELQVEYSDSHRILINSNHLSKDYPHRKKTLPKCLNIFWWIS